MKVAALEDIPAHFAAGANAVGVFEAKANALLMLTDQAGPTGVDIAGHCTATIVTVTARAPASNC